ncbi:MAG: ABC transporter ATP-binding protein [Oscillospiraceae bacterium]|jgi:peptide/nickel transport system ATP-binding protein|nr:ABC transporter ATP-binding protein [Oscillospiraceae bacterium]
MLLEVKNLKTEFIMKKGTVKAVNDISFNLNKGETLAIVGESGSGKSVTSLSIMGLLQKPGEVTGGEILFKGENLLKKSISELRKIRGDQLSMIFQEPMTSLNPVYRIKDQLLESIKIHMHLPKEKALERALEVLNLVGIPSAEKRMNDFPHQMSGGMRQRVMIAMALSCHPELLIADEPTTALDVTIQAQILDLLQDLQEKLHMSILLITHDLGVVAETADKVAVMYCGKIVEEAAVKDLFSTPRHPYTIGLLESIPKLDENRKRLYMIRGMVPNPMDMPLGCAFSDRCEHCVDKCRSKVPALMDVGNQKVRCFLFGDSVEENG